MPASHAGTGPSISERCAAGGQRRGLAAPRGTAPLVSRQQRCLRGPNGPESVTGTTLVLRRQGGLGQRTAESRPHEQYRDGRRPGRGMLRACLAVLGAAECSPIHRFLLQTVCKNPFATLLFFRITCTDKLNQGHASTSQNEFLTRKPATSFGKEL